MPVTPVIVKNPIIFNRNKEISNAEWLEINKATMKLGEIVTGKLEETEVRTGKNCV